MRELEASVKDMAERLDKVPDDHVWTMEETDALDDLWMSVMDLRNAILFIRELLTGTVHREE